jgi:hypothetical protein
MFNIKATAEQIRVSSNRGSATRMLTHQLRQLAHVMATWLHMSIKPTVYPCIPCLQGCSGQQEQDTALLLQVAGLLQAMERQRGSTSSDAASQQELVPADTAVSQLVTNACSNLAKLTSDSMQLFATDMNDVLKTYR